MSQDTSSIYPRQVRVNGTIVVTWDGNTKTCSCGVKIGFGVTEMGKRMPFEFDDKNTSHFATCKDLAKFRKG